jgi:hypothetical protein
MIETLLSRRQKRTCSPNLKWHPQARLAALNWEHPQVQFVPTAVRELKGYVAVFFPEKHGPGGGNAYFEWSGPPVWRRRNCAEGVTH